MKILPAIDILDGKAVRLRKGKREDVTIYSDEPWNLAKDYADQGANMLHVVDLTGAFAGKPQSFDIIARLAKESGLDLQVGGGIRELEHIQQLINTGAKRVVLGTKAVSDPDFLQAACQRFPKTIVVAVDAFGDKVATKGWQQTAETSPLGLSQQAADYGAAAVLYTDIDRDGVEVGPNIERTAKLRSELPESIKVIASGGVGTLDHLRQLTATRADEVIVGRALLAGNFTLAEAKSL